MLMAEYIYNINLTEGTKETLFYVNYRYVGQITRKARVLAAVSERANLK